MTLLNTRWRFDNYESRKKIVKLCLHLSYIVQISFHFDEIFHVKFKFPILLCMILRRHLVSILGNISTKIDHPPIDPATPGQQVQPSSAKKKSRKRPNAAESKKSGGSSPAATDPKNRKKSSETGSEEVLKARKFLDMGQGMTTTTTTPAGSMPPLPMMPTAPVPPSSLPLPTSALLPPPAALSSSSSSGSPILNSALTSPNKMQQLGQPRQPFMQPMPQLPTQPLATGPRPSGGPILASMLQRPGAPPQSTSTIRTPPAGVVNKITPTVTSTSPGAIGTGCPNKF